MFGFWTTTYTTISPEFHDAAQMAGCDLDNPFAAVFGNCGSYTDNQTDDYMAFLAGGNLDNRAV